MMLLEQLLALCCAHRGALLLPRGPSVALTLSSSPSPAHMGMFRTLAQRGMSEEEIVALLAAFAAAGAAVQTPAEVPDGLLCRFPLAGVPAEQGGPVLFPLDALLVLSWHGMEQETSIRAREKGHVLLPLVADVAGVILTNFLLCERVHELETVMKHQAQRESEVLQAELLAGVSHELRSPLTSIKGTAETLLRLEQRLSGKKRHEFLLVVKEASDRLAVVIDRLMQMAQLDTGTLLIERFPVNLAQLVREALTAAERRLGATGPQKATAAPQEQVTFTLRLEDLHGRSTSDEPLIQADRHRLREVLEHLLENAIDYSPQGGTIEVTIRPMSRHALGERLQTSRKNPTSGGTEQLLLSQAWKDQQGVEMCVRDEGIGIAAEHLERIFDRFHRLDTRLTREVNGLGLGLAICKRIVERHEGMIWAESEVGRGSVFHVWLPGEVDA